MSSVLRALVLLVIALTFGYELSAQFNNERFQNFGNRVYETFDLPSMTMMVVQGDEIVYSAAWGAKGNQSNPGLPDEQTLYAIASLSKAFTAASIGMLVDDGLIKWNDKVKQHLPWFEMYDPYVTEDLTIEDLLCHRSGLITFDGDLLWYGTNYTQKEAVERIRHRPPSLPLRAGFGYQNLMYMTAGEVIEAVSGLDWHTFVAQRILNPLGMSRTTSSYEAFIADNNMAMPHLKGDEIGTLSYHNSGATAALNSCTYDMSRWLSFWINDGIVDGDTLLQPATIKKIWSLHTPLAVGRFDEQNGTHFKGYGLGWFLMDYQGLKVVHHGGGLPGYITKAAIVPEKDLGIIVLTNDMSSASTMMMYAVIDAFEGRDYEHWLETFLNFKQQSEKREADALDARRGSKNDQPKVYEEEDYAGKYQDKMYGEASVEFQNGSLTLIFKPAKELFSGKLSAWDDHQFRWDHQDPFLTYGLVQFHVEDDRVIGFSIDLPNDDFHFDKLDFKKMN